MSYDSRRQNRAMTYDDGVLTVYKTVNTAESGAMPAETLQKVSEHYYGERTVGYGRQYAARAVNEQVDLLVRIWQDRGVRIGMLAVPEDGEQYRITNVQHLDDDSGLAVTDLSLERLGDNYDAAGEA